MEKRKRGILVKKVFWLDCETGGLNSKINPIIQLAFCVKFDGVVKENGNLLIQPFSSDIIEDSALDVNKRTRQEIAKTPFIPPLEAHRILTNTLSKYVNKMDRYDKFYIGGYNVCFDANFLGDFFTKCDDPYVGSWFNFRQLDPLRLLNILDYVGAIALPNYKLSTVCEHFGIHLEAHDAFSDIEATMQLWDKVFEFVAKEGFLKRMVA